MRKLLFFALFLLPILFLLPNLNDFPFHPDSEFSDLTISHYPNGLYLQRTLTQLGEIPLWSPGILSGTPFAANPLSGLYYLPGWLALFFPLPYGFNLVVVLHLIWGGLGMYLLLRAEGLSEFGSLFGALLFEAMPKLYGHLGAGHLTLLYAVPWTPWLLLAANHSAGMASALRWVLPGLVLGTIALADVRWAAYAGLAWLAYSLRPSQAPRVQAGRAWQRAGQRLVGILANTAVALLTAAPLMLPLLEYARLSTRSALTPADNLIFSLPPLQLLGLIFPYLRGPAEGMLYPGAAAMALLVFNLVNPWARRRAAYWTGVVLVGLVFALGSYLPPLELLARLPGFDLLRVPARALFLVGMGFAAVASHTLDGMLHPRAIEEEPTTSPQRKPNLNLVVFALLVFVILIGGGVALTAENGPLRLQFGWGAGMFTLCVLLLTAIKLRWAPPRSLSTALTVVALADLLAFNMVGLIFKPFIDVIAPSSEPAAYLAARSELRPFRVYSPSYSLPQHVAALYDLELADGVDPLQLAAYAGYMQAASGVPSNGYSVTLPPYANGAPAADNKGYRPNARQLGLLNVRYVVSAYELPGASLRLLARVGETRIYENPFVLPRAWVQRPESALGVSLSDAPVVELRPNEVIVRAAHGPGRLVLSEIAYPGWTVLVDGQPAEVLTAADLLRAVDLPPGEHTVIFRFQPKTVFAGLALAGLTWLTVIGLWAVQARRTPRVIAYDRA